MLSKDAFLNVFLSAAYAGMFCNVMLTTMLQRIPSKMVQFFSKTFMTFFLQIKSTKQMFIRKKCYIDHIKAFFVTDLPTVNFAVDVIRRAVKKVISTLI